MARTQSSPEILQKCEEWTPNSMRYPGCKGQCLLKKLNNALGFTDGIFQEGVLYQLLKEKQKPVSQPEVMTNLFYHVCY